MSVSAINTGGSSAVDLPVLATGVLCRAVPCLQRVSLSELVRRWHTQDEYSHGFLIPLVAAWLLWTRRDALAGQSIGRPSWAAGADRRRGAMHVVGELSALYLLSQAGVRRALCSALPLSWVGSGSCSRSRSFRSCSCCLRSRCRISSNSVLSFRLQLISSELGVFFIRLFQVPVYLEGNVIDLGTYKLQVVEACSGLRYLYPLLSLGFLAAYLFQAPLWQRVVVFLSTIPITIVMNSFRIGMVGVLVDRWGPNKRTGCCISSRAGSSFLPAPRCCRRDVPLVAHWIG